jgi:hypothetical protein
MIGYIRDNIGSVRTAKDRLRTLHISFLSLLQIARSGGTNVLTAVFVYRVLCRWVSGGMHDAMSGIYLAFKDLSKVSPQQCIVVHNLFRRPRLPSRWYTPIQTKSALQHSSKQTIQNVLSNTSRMRVKSNSNMHTIKRVYRGI